MCILQINEGFCKRIHGALHVTCLHFIQPECKSLGPAAQVRKCELIRSCKPLAPKALAKATFCKALAKAKFSKAWKRPASACSKKPTALEKALAEDSALAKWVKLELERFFQEKQALGKVARGQVESDFHLEGKRFHWHRELVERLKKDVERSHIRASSTSGP